MVNTSLPKLRQAVRYHLQGAASVDSRFLVALDAFNYVEEITEGKFRADGVTPEFSHPLSVTALLMTLQPSLSHPADTFAAALLHDVAEDLGVSIEAIRDRFGRPVAHGVLRVSKVLGGIKTENLDKHFAEMGDCPIATVLKGCDRAVNLSTMGPEFPAERQLKQVAETERYILPMLKSARRRFPAQAPAYENLKFIISGQLHMLRVRFASPAAVQP